MFMGRCGADTDLVRSAVEICAEMNEVCIIRTCMQLSSNMISVMISGKLLQSSFSKLLRVRFPGPASDFSPVDSFQCRLRASLSGLKEE